MNIKENNKISFNTNIINNLKTIKKADLNNSNLSKRKVLNDSELFFNLLKKRNISKRSNINKLHYNNYLHLNSVTNNVSNQVSLLNESNFKTIENDDIFNSNISLKRKGFNYKTFLNSQSNIFAYSGKKIYLKVI